MPGQHLPSCVTGQVFWFSVFLPVKVKWWYLTHRTVVKIELINIKHLAKFLIEADRSSPVSAQLNEPGPQSSSHCRVFDLLSNDVSWMWVGKTWEQNKRSGLSGAGSFSPKGRVRSWPWCWSQGSHATKGERGVESAVEMPWRQARPGQRGVTSEVPAPRKRR